ncbi:peptide chain release factor H [Fulvitalea axinellae]|uniref:Peptide chain release factor H n=1 Tax=Fulvitalea axinellae TaxID=1182444 RepID=A0AAU9CIE8_9BACT|nr:peptide chain release factor H [Fulvitalea axinellae]
MRGNSYLVQITSGRGPAECCLAVAKLTKAFLKEAKKSGLEAKVAERNAGPETNTLSSALIEISGKEMENFRKSWEGSVLWITKSPYRKFHKRKNWFVGVRFIERNTGKISSRRIEFQAVRASGPGGQHVNKTSTAVRATDLATGISVLAQDSRSQKQNKALALERLEAKFRERELADALDSASEQWETHLNLERGNPIRTFRGPEFREI